MNKKLITIIGCGPGSADYVTPEAYKMVSYVSVIFGAKRLLTLFSSFMGQKIEITTDLESIYAKIDEFINLNINIGVLVTGDPSIASIAKPILNRFGIMQCQIIAGISSIQIAANRLGIDLTESLIINAHKDIPDVDSESRVDKRNTIILMGNKRTHDWIFSFVSRVQQTHELYVCSDLTLETECIKKIEKKELRLKTIECCPVLSILVCINRNEMI